jgi:hypothetical protein
MTERPTEQTHPRLNGLDASSTTAPTLPPMPAAPESDRPEYRPQTAEPARPSLAERLQQKVSTVRQAERPAERLDSTSVRPAVQASTAAPTAPAPATPTGEDRPVLPPPAADQAPPQPAAAPAKKRPARASRPKRPPRRARLRLTRIDPWSVMKTAFLLSIAFGIMCVVAVFIVWSVLTAANVFGSINESMASLLDESFAIEDYIGMDRVLSFTMLVAVLNVVLLTAIATLGAFLYNLAASLLGGLEVTLAEDDHR